MLQKQFLVKAFLEHKRIKNYNDYPFLLPVIRKLKMISFHSNVTFLIGENGTGKSTILEAIAVALGFNPEGGSRNFNFSTYESHSQLWKYLKLQRGIRKPKDSYFFRAESYYNLASEIERLDSIICPAPPIKGSYGGKSLHAQSHGESFYSLIYNRLGGNGLYLFDEPEAALSPKKQLELLYRMDQLIKQDSQFIIATHSPIIMAYPNSKILKIDEDKLIELKYEETEHYQFTKLFLEEREKMLSMLFSDSDFDE